MKQIILIACAAVALAGCVREDRSMCPPEINPNQTVTEVLSLRAFDIDTDEDITDTGTVTDATLVLFDPEGNFLEQIDIPGDRLMDDIEIPITLRDYVGDVYVSAWGNIKDNVNFPDDFSDANYSETRSLDLLHDPQYDGFHLCPGETFFGTQKITLGGLDELTTPTRQGETVVRRQQIDIKQKNAKLFVTARGLPEPGPQEDYYIVVSNLDDGYIFDGTPNTENPDAPADIREQKGIYQANGDLTSQAPMILIHQRDPEKVDQNTTMRLDLYRVSQVEGEPDIHIGGTVMSDQFGNAIPLYSGKQTSVLITFSGGCGCGAEECTCGADCDCCEEVKIVLEMKVIDWHEVSQWTQINFGHKDSK